MLEYRPHLAVAVALAVACLGSVANGEHVQVSDSGLGAYEVSLTPWSDGLVVAWYDTRDGNAEIYLRRLGADGRPVGREYRMTDDPEQSYEADIDAADDGIAIAWYDEREDGALRARLAFWNPLDGTRWRTDLSARGGATRNPVVRSHAGARIFVAWIEQGAGGAEAVWAQWRGTNGERLAPPVELGAAGATTWNLNAEVDADGVAYVVFDARIDTAVEELYVARVDGRDVQLRRLTSDDGHRSKYPDLALSHGRAALTWFDERDGQREVYLYAGPFDVLDERVERAARRITETPGASIGAYVGWNDDRIGLAWSDERDGAYEVYFQAFDGDGNAIAEAERVTDTPESSLIPAIRPWRDAFAIAWNEVPPGPDGMHDPATRSQAHFAIVH